MNRHGLSFRAKTSVSQKLPTQLEKKLESFLTQVIALRARHQYPLDLIINMDETPMYFDMVPQRTINKKGAGDVQIRSSGAEKRRLTIAVTCTGDGNLLTAVAIFKGKRKLKFSAPKEVQTAVQIKGWMDSDLMVRWFRSVILPHTKGRRALLAIDSFSAHETEEFIDLAHSNNVDVVIIPGGCTSKIQPLDVCLNKPFKSVVRKRWIEYVHSLVDTEVTPSSQDKLATPKKPTLVQWIKDGLEYLKQRSEMSFLVCGITNSLDGSENHYIRCAKELEGIDLPYTDGSDDPFADIDDNSDDENNELVEESEDDCD